MIKPAPLVDISGSTRVFYSRRGIQITDRWFATSGKRYALADLSDIREAREPSNPITIGAVLASLCLFGAGVVVATRTGSTASLETTMLASLALMVIGVVSNIVHPRHRLVLATVNDFDVVLFATRDRSLQSQVHRALDRANRAAHTADPTAAARSGPTAATN
jgi:hypothetical protein